MLKGYYDAPQRAKFVHENAAAFKQSIDYYNRVRDTFNKETQRRRPVSQLPEGDASSGAAALARSPHLTTEEKKRVYEFNKHYIQAGKQLAELSGFGDNVTQTYKYNVDGQLVAIVQRAPYNRKTAKLAQEARGRSHANIWLEETDSKGKKYLERELLTGVKTHEDQYLEDLRSIDYGLQEAFGGGYKMEGGKWVKRTEGWVDKERERIKKIEDRAIANSLTAQIKRNIYEITDPQSAADRVVAQGLSALTDGLSMLFAYPFYYTYDVLSAIPKAFGHLFTYETDPHKSIHADLLDFADGLWGAITSDSKAHELTLGSRVIQQRWTDQINDIKDPGKIEKFAQAGAGMVGRLAAISVAAKQGNIPAIFGEATAVSSVAAINAAATINFARTAAVLSGIEAFTRERDRHYREDTIRFSDYITGINKGLTSAWIIHTVYAGKIPLLDKTGKVGQWISKGVIPAKPVEMLAKKELKKVALKTAKDIIVKTLITGGVKNPLRMFSVGEINELVDIGFDLSSGNLEPGRFQEFYRGIFKRFVEQYPALLLWQLPTFVRGATAAIEIGKLHRTIDRYSKISVSGEQIDSFEKAMFITLMLRDGGKYFKQLPPEQQQYFLNMFERFQAELGDLGQQPGAEQFARNLFEKNISDLHEGMDYVGAMYARMLKEVRSLIEAGETQQAGLLLDLFNETLWQTNYQHMWLLHSLKEGKDGKYWLKVPPYTEKERLKVTAIIKASDPGRDLTKAEMEEIDRLIAGLPSLTDISFSKETVKKLEEVRSIITDAAVMEDILWQMGLHDNLDNIREHVWGQEKVYDVDKKGRAKERYQERRSAGEEPRKGADTADSTFYPLGGEPDEPVERKGASASAVPDEQIDAAIDKKFASIVQRRMWAATSAFTKGNERAKERAKELFALAASDGRTTHITQLTDEENHKLNEILTGGANKRFSSKELPLEARNLIDRALNETKDKPKKDAKDTDSEPVAPVSETEGVDAPAITPGTTAEPATPTGSKKEPEKIIYKYVIPSDKDEAEKELKQLLQMQANEPSVKDIPVKKKDGKSGRQPITERIKQLREFLGTAKKETKPTSKKQTVSRSTKPGIVQHTKKGAEPDYEISRRQDGKFTMDVPSEELKPEKMHLTVPVNEEFFDFDEVAPKDLPNAKFKQVKPAILEQTPDGFKVIEKGKIEAIISKPKPAETPTQEQKKKPKIDAVIEPLEKGTNKRSRVVIREHPLHELDTSTDPKSTVSLTPGALSGSNIGNTHLIYGELFHFKVIPIGKGYAFKQVRPAIVRDLGDGKFEIIKKGEVTVDWAASAKKTTDKIFEESDKKPASPKDEGSKPKPGGKSVNVYQDQNDKLVASKGDDYVAHTLTENNDGSYSLNIPKESLGTNTYLTVSTHRDYFDFQQPGDSNLSYNDIKQLRPAIFEKHGDTYTLVKKGFVGWELKEAPPKKAPAPKPKATEDEPLDTQNLKHNEERLKVLKNKIRDYDKRGEKPPSSLLKEYNKVADRIDELKGVIPTEPKARPKPTPKPTKQAPKKTAKETKKLSDKDYKQIAELEKQYENLDDKKLLGVWGKLKNASGQKGATAKEKNAFRAVDNLRREREGKEPKYRPVVTETSPAPEAKAKMPALPKSAHVGKESHIVMPEGDKVGVVNVLLPIDKVLKSHDHQTFKETEGYDIKRFQVRSRDAKESKLQINRMAENIVPEHIVGGIHLGGGSPVVIEEDGKLPVIDGNGRTMALEEAYDRGKADGYVEHLKENAEKYGFTKEQVEAIEKPILVRLVTDDKITPEEIARQANIPQTTDISTVDQAKQDAKLIDSRLLALLIEAGGDITNKDFINQFVLKVIAESEVTSYLTDGKPTSELKTRIERALIAKAYGDNETTRYVIEQVVVIEGETMSLVRYATEIAADVLKLKQAISKGNVQNLDISDDIIGAIKLALTLLRSKETYSEYKEQHDIFSEGVAADDILLTQDALNNLIINNRDKWREVIKILKNYHYLALDSAQSDIFVSADLDQARHKILERAIMESNLDGSSQIEVKFQKNFRETNEQLIVKESTETEKGLQYEILKDHKPRKTMKVYKLVQKKVSKPGEIFSLFIGSTEPFPVGEWFRGKHTPTAGYSDRPGLHAGRLPWTPHLRQKTTGKMHPMREWWEVEISADVDWQSVADRSKTKDIRGKVPEGGYYSYPRPKSQGGEWLIAGEMKFVRPLTLDEVVAIRAEAGIDDILYQKDKPKTERIKERMLRLKRGSARKVVPRAGRGATVTAQSFAKLHGILTQYLSPELSDATITVLDDIAQRMKKEFPAAQMDKLTINSVHWIDDTIEENTLRDKIIELHGAETELGGEIVFQRKQALKGRPTRYNNPETQKRIKELKKTAIVKEMFGTNDLTYDQIESSAFHTLLHSTGEQPMISKAMVMLYYNKIKELIANGRRQALLTYLGENMDLINIAMWTELGNKLFLELIPELRDHGVLGALKSSAMFQRFIYPRNIIVAMVEADPSDSTFVAAADQPLTPVELFEKYGRSPALTYTALPHINCMNLADFKERISHSLPSIRHNGRYLSNEQFDVIYDTYKDTPAVISDLVTGARVGTFLRFAERTPEDEVLELMRFDGIVSMIDRDPRWLMGAEANSHFDENEVIKMLELAKKAADKEISGALEVVAAIEKNVSQCSVETSEKAYEILFDIISNAKHTARAQGDRQLTRRTVNKLYEKVRGDRTKIIQLGIVLHTLFSGEANSDYATKMLRDDSLKDDGGYTLVNTIDSLSNYGYWLSDIVGNPDLGAAVIEYYDKKFPPNYRLGRGLSAAVLEHAVRLDPSNKKEAAELRKIAEIINYYEAAEYLEFLSRSRRDARTVAARAFAPMLDKYIKKLHDEGNTEDVVGYIKSLSAGSYESVNADLLPETFKILEKDKHILDTDDISDIILKPGFSPDIPGTVHYAIAGLYGMDYAKKLLAPAHPNDTTTYALNQMISGGIIKFQNIKENQAQAVVKLREKVAKVALFFQDLGVEHVSLKEISRIFSKKVYDRNGKLVDKGAVLNVLKLMLGNRDFNLMKQKPNEPITTVSSWKPLMDGMTNGGIFINSMRRGSPLQTVFGYDYAISMLADGLHPNDLRKDRLIIRQASSAHPPGTVLILYNRVKIDENGNFNFTESDDFDAIVITEYQSDLAQDAEGHYQYMSDAMHQQELENFDENEYRKLYNYHVKNHYNLAIPHVMREFTRMGAKRVFLANSYTLRQVLNAGMAEQSARNLYDKFLPSKFHCDKEVLRVTAHDSVGNRPSTEIELREVRIDDLDSVKWQMDDTVIRGLTYTYQNGDIGVLLGKDADGSTLPHEFAHVYLRWLRTAAMTDEKARTVLQTISDYLGMPYGKFDSDAEEKFVAGFMKVLYDGVKAGGKVGKAYETMSEYLRMVWDGTKNAPDVELPPEIYALYEYIFGTKTFEQVFPVASKKIGRELSAELGVKRSRAPPTIDVLANAKKLFDTRKLSETSYTVTHRESGAFFDVEVTPEGWLIVDGLLCENTAAMLNRIAQVISAFEPEMSYGVVFQTDDKNVLDNIKYSAKEKENKARVSAKSLRALKNSVSGRVNVEAMRRSLQSAISSYFTSKFGITEDSTEEEWLQYHLAIRSLTGYDKLGDATTFELVDALETIRPGISETFLSSPFLKLMREVVGIAGEGKDAGYAEGLFSAVIEFVNKYSGGSLKLSRLEQNLVNPLVNLLKVMGYEGKLVVDKASEGHLMQARMLSQSATILDVVSDIYNNTGGKNKLGHQYIYDAQLQAGGIVIQSFEEAEYGEERNKLIASLVQAHNKKADPDEGIFELSAEDLILIAEQTKQVMDLFEEGIDWLSNKMGFTVIGKIESNYIPRLLHGMPNYYEENLYSEDGAFGSSVSEAYKLDVPAHAKTRELEHPPPNISSDLFHVLRNYVMTMAKYIAYYPLVYYVNNEVPLKTSQHKNYQLYLKNYLDSFLAPIPGMTDADIVLNAARTVKTTTALAFNIKVSLLNMIQRTLSWNYVNTKVFRKTTFAVNPINGKMLRPKRHPRLSAVIGVANMADDNLFTENMVKWNSLDDSKTPTGAIARYMKVMAKTADPILLHSMFILAENANWGFAYLAGAMQLVSSTNVFRTEYKKLKGAGVGDNEAWYSAIETALENPEIAMQAVRSAIEINALVNVDPAPTFTPLIFSKKSPVSGLTWFMRFAGRFFEILFLDNPMVSKDFHNRLAMFFTDVGEGKDIETLQVIRDLTTNVFSKKNIKKHARRMYKLHGIKINDLNEIREALLLIEKHHTDNMADAQVYMEHRRGKLILKNSVGLLAFLAGQFIISLVGELIKIWQIDKIGRHLIPEKSADRKVKSRQKGIIGKAALDATQIGRLAAGMPLAQGLFPSVSAFNQGTPKSWMRGIMAYLIEYFPPSMVLSIALETITGLKLEEIIYENWFGQYSSSQSKERRIQ